MKSWLNSELKAFYDVINESEVEEIFTGCTGICYCFIFSTIPQAVDQSLHWEMKLQCSDKSPLCNLPELLSKCDR